MQSEIFTDSELYSRMLNDVIHFATYLSENWHHVFYGQEI